MTITAAILDTETTGIGKSDTVIELAWLGFPALEKLKTPLFSNPVLDQKEVRYRPKVPIHPAAQAVHGITVADLKDCPSPTTIVNDLPQATYWIGHKIDFDLRMVGQAAQKELPEVKLICTHSLATKVLTVEERTEIPNLKLTSLCQYFFPQYLSEVDQEGHSAIGDCTLVLMLLDILVARTPAITWDDLYSFTMGGKEPKEKRKKNDGTTLLEVWPPFGKHKGELFQHIPISYLSWARDTLDFSRNPNLLFTINHWIAKQQ